MFEPAEMHLEKAGEVPLLHSPGLDRHIAALVFRVGRYDETLLTSGITHLVEHLVMTHVGQRPYHVNATVEGRFTRFVVDSRHPNDLVDFFGRVSSALGSLKTDSIEHERRILRTEAAGRSLGAYGVCLSERFGATGPGLLGFREVGLHKVGAEDVRAWAERWFVAENAALWLWGSPPDGLNVELPNGQRNELDHFRPKPIRLPTYVDGWRGEIVSSLIWSRDDAPWTALDVLERRLTDRLRHAHGISYSVVRAQEHLTSEQSHALFAADTLEEQAAAVAEEMLSVFDALIEHGCSQEELDDFVRRTEDQLSTSLARPSLLDSHAQRLLEGRPIRSEAELLDRIRQVTPEAVAEAAKELFSTSLFLAPDDVPALTIRIGRASTDSTPIVTGERFSPIPRGDKTRALVVGREGASMIHEKGRSTVPYDRTAALLVWPDGQQSLIGEDGSEVFIHQAFWQDADRAMSEIMKNVEDGLAVKLDEPGPLQGIEPQAARIIPRPLAWLTARAIQYLSYAAVAMIVIGVVMHRGSSFADTPNPRAETFALVLASTGAAIAVGLWLYAWWLKRRLNR